MRSFVFQINYKKQKQLSCKKKKEKKEGFVRDDGSRLKRSQVKKCTPISLVEDHSTCTTIATCRPSEKVFSICIIVLVYFSSSTSFDMKRSRTQLDFCESKRVHRRFPLSTWSHFISLVFDSIIFCAVHSGFLGKVFR